MKLTRSVQALGVAIGMFCMAATAQASSYPDKPVRLVVGFSPGSTIDTVARIIGDGLSKRLNQPFVIDNRAGANGMIAARAVASAQPDGHTLLVSNSSSITVNPLLYDDLGYDPLTDYEPITTVVSVPFVLTINPDNPRMKGVNSVHDLVKLAREKPEEVSYGSAGNGNLMHLAGAQLAAMSDTEMLHVPYKGAAPMQAALLSKEIDFGFDTLAGVPLMKSGKLKPLAISASEPWRDLPGVPTVAAEGFDGFDVSFWVGTFVPKGTPPEIVATLNEAIAAVSQDPEIQQRLMLQGNVLNMSPAEFRQKIEHELKQNEDLIKKANIKIGN